MMRSDQQYEYILKHIEPIVLFNMPFLLSTKLQHILYKVLVCR